MNFKKKKWIWPFSIILIIVLFYFVVNLIDSYYWWRAKEQIVAWMFGFGLFFVYSVVLLIERLFYYHKAMEYFVVLHGKLYKEGSQYCFEFTDSVVKEREYALDYIYEAKKYFKRRKKFPVILGILFVMVLYIYLVKCNL